jgi:hypothetical protein
MFYGPIEILVGLFLTVLSLQVTGGAFSRDFSNDFDTFHYAVTITTYLGAIFVMVQGCDNIRQGWTARARSIWTADREPHKLHSVKLRCRAVSQNMQFLSRFCVLRISCRPGENSPDLALARTLASIFEASNRSKFDWIRKSAFRSTVFARIASFRTVCLIFTRS